MARRKKRSPAREAGKDGSETEHSVQGQKPRPTLPPARPPKKNLPLLLVCVSLLCVWLVLLVLLAWSS